MLYSLHSFQVSEFRISLQQEQCINRFLSVKWLTEKRDLVARRDATSEETAPVCGDRPTYTNLAEFTDSFFAYIFVLFLNVSFKSMSFGRSWPSDSFRAHVKYLGLYISYISYGVAARPLTSDNGLHLQKHDIMNSVVCVRFFQQRAKCCFFDCVFSGLHYFDRDLQNKT